VPEKSTDFRAAILRLAEADVRYVLIGGLAMIVRGASHITTDIDICYDRTNVAPLLGVLNDSHARLRGEPADLPFILDSQTFKNVLNLTLDTDIGDMDLLAEPDGIDSFEGLWQRAEDMELYGVIVRVASIDDLISMKSAAGRQKDKQHLLELQDLKRMLAEDEAGSRDGTSQGDA